MSFFHRPGESSSEESSTEDDDNVDESSHDISHDSVRISTGTAEEIIVPDTSAEPLSLTNTISGGGDGVVVDVDEARNVMIASLLEELTKYKSAELLNNANVSHGAFYHKNSPEVQDLAKSLFARSSGVLYDARLMSAESASDMRRSERAQYLSALERWSYRNGDVDSVRRSSGDRGVPGRVSGSTTALVRRQSQQPMAFQATTAGHLQQVTWQKQNMSVVGRPNAEFQSSLAFAPFRLRSHYSDTFEERGLLGKGGFGRVYQTYNVFDQREYAVKKIPLSPGLSKLYRQGGLRELTHILKESQALAQLDHANVVRYHATWIEEPTWSVGSNDTTKMQTSDREAQLLLDNKPTKGDDEHRITAARTHAEELGSSSGPELDLPVVGRSLGATSKDNNDKASFDPFDQRSENGDGGRLLWSYRKSHASTIDECRSDIFSDDRAHHSSGVVSNVMHNPATYVLHVQMSMYPSTLANYLLPVLSDPYSSDLAQFRHCFHLVPALKILLAILCGLQYIHVRGFIHRDLKPSNIFLSQLGSADSPGAAVEQGYIEVGHCPSCRDSRSRLINPRIGDFGLVADLEHAATRGFAPGVDKSVNGKAVGTEYYRPPSHMNSNTLPDEKVDVFALGVITLELLWACSTQMERIQLLQGCQKGTLPLKMKAKLVEEAFNQEVTDMTEACVLGMIDSDPRERWTCAMVKSNVESILHLTPGASVSRNQKDR